MLKWLLPVNANNVQVDICSTRACTSTIATVALNPSSTSGTPTADLPKGVVYWRVRAMSGSATGTSKTWEFFVGSRTAGVDTRWGAVLDVNGDGYADLSVGEPGSNKVFVYHGSAAGLSTTPNSTITGSGSFGSNVASAGDINGDGFSDLIVGAPSTTASTGAAYVYLGSPSGLGATPSAATSFYPTSSGDLFGTAVIGCGDVDGDGYGDVAIGAPQHPQPGQAATQKGVVYFFRGSANGFGNSPTLPPPIYTTEGGNFGGSIGAGDLDGNGYADLVVGASYAPYSAGYGPGKAYVFLGTNSGPMAAAVVSMTPPDGTAQTGSFGISVASGLDVNGDGYADFVVGNEFGGGSARSGNAFVYIGGTTISNMPASGWGTLNGGTANNLFFGSAVSSAGDVNGDGYDDIAVGAYNMGNGGAFFFLGGSSGVSSSFTSPNNPSPPGSGWGAFAIGGAGDINLDGFPDLFVGAPCALTSCSTPSVYLYSGGASGITSNELPVSGWGILTSTDGATSQFGYSCY